MIDFNLGTIFTINEYSEAYKYVSENGYTIEEIEPKGDERQFKIVEIPQPSEKDKAEERINELKTWLDETDYKIIKCYEASMLGQELPYNLESLVQERNSWREEIRELEKLI